MIRIAYCDDDPAVLHQLRVLLDAYRPKQDCTLEYTGYQSPLELLAAIERGHSYQVILLDVLMPGENGIDAAREIRARDENVKLIFISSSPEYAVQSYSVGAFYYLVKPLREDSFFSLLDRVLSLCRPTGDRLLLQTKSGITVISPAQLEYCEIANHTLRLYMRDGQLLEKVGNLDDLARRLAATGGFLRIHRSYLVNMACIQQITGKTVTMASGAQLPLPHGKFGEIKDAFLQYAFEKGQVLL